MHFGFQRVDSTTQQTDASEFAVEVPQKKLTPPNQHAAGHSSISVMQDKGKNAITPGAVRSWPQVRHAALDAFAFNYMQADYGRTANEE
jgi:hypothetical protein